MQEFWSNKMTGEVLFVTVRGRSGVVYEGNALSLSSYNDKGKFDILPGHANFITIIQNNLVIVDRNRNKHKIELANGVMRVMNNQVDVYLGVKR